MARPTLENAKKRRLLVAVDDSFDKRIKLMADAKEMPVSALIRKTMKEAMRKEGF